MGKICGKEDCPLYKNSSMIFDPIKSGNNPKIMLVMDSPDLNDRTRIFQNENTNFLFNCLEKYGVSEISGPFLCATSVRCAGDMSKFSESQKTTAQKCCREYFAETVHKWKPKLILSFGAMSLTQTTKHKGIKNHQGNLEYIEEWGCHVMPCYGPGYILRNMAFEGTWASAFNTVKNFIEEGWQPPKDDGKYEIEEVQSLKGLFSEEDCKNGIAIDTETQGLDWTHPNFTCVSYSVCGGDGTKGYQIYLFEESSEEDSDYSILWERPRKTEKGFTSKKFPTLVHVKRSENFYQKREELRWFLENDRIKKVMHNGSYDCHVFKAFFKVAGRLLNLPHDKRVINIKGYDFDTQNAAQLLDENLYAMSKLETLQKDMTDISERYDSGVFQKNFDKGDMLAVEKEALTRYAVLDTITSQRVYLHLKKELESKSNKKLERYMERFVMPTVNTLMEMEHTGAFVDVPRLEQAQHDITKLRDEEHNLAMSFIPKAVIEKHRSKGLKLSRNDLVRDTLFSEEGYKLKPEKKTKSGEPSADQDSLKLMLDKIRNKKALEFIRHFTEYKKYDTLAGRYLAGFEKFRACDGRIHSKFSICQAATGRSSAQKPNVQNIPNRGDAAPIVRRIIGARPGYKILKADASQAELRWMSHYAQDKTMQKVFIDNIVDIHTATAMSIVNINDPHAWDALSDAEKKFKRKVAKPVNFGYLYHMHPLSFIPYAKVEYGVDVSEEEALAYHKAYFDKYSRLQEYYQEVVAYGKEYGYVESQLGRRRRLPELNSHNKGLFNQAMRQAINFPIQSSSSDAVLMAANEIRKMGLPKGDFRLILFIHDELVAEVREDCDIDKYARIMKESIENPPLKELFGINLTVPLESEVEFGDNLNDCKKWKFSK